MVFEERIYDPREVISFRKTTEAFGGLSNMCAGYPIMVNNVVIPSAEHFYQACRYPLFPQYQHEIIRERSPMTAKMKSKKHLQYTRQDWENVKTNIMRWVILIKLQQNWDRFGEVLLSTGHATIVEESHRDKIWGAKRIDGKLIGVNALGRLLMDVRNKYVHNSIKIQDLDAPKIPGLLLFNTMIYGTHNSSVQLAMWLKHH